MLRPRVAMQGVTLVELLVAMTIVAVLLGLGLPSISTYLQSSKLASTAQGYLAGVQTARAEAIRRNLPVQFVLTDTPVDAIDIANTAVAAVNGKNWIVRVMDSTLLPPAFVLIESKASAEGAFSTTVPSVQIAGTGAPTAFIGVVPFNGFGATADLSNYQLDLWNPAGGACAPAGPMHCPRILIPSGGLIHLCDPTVSALNDSRGC